MAATTTNHWKLGLFVVLGVVAMVGALFWIGARRFNRDSFTAVTFFDESVQGLDVGSPVKFRGVPIGTVADITVGPDRRHLQVTAHVHVDAMRRLGLADGRPDPASGRPFLPENLRVQLAASGITGVKFLEIDFFDPERYPPPPLPFSPPWEYIPAAPSTLRSLEQAALAFADRLPELGDEATTTLAEGRAALGAIRQLAEELDGADGAVARLVARLDETAMTFEKAVHDAQLAETTDALRGASVSVRGAADGLNAEVADVREDLRASLVSLRETLDAIRFFVESLERDPSMLVRGRRTDGTGPGTPR